MKNYPKELLIAEKERLEIAAKNEEDYIERTGILQVITNQYEPAIKALDNLTSSSRIMSVTKERTYSAKEMEKSFQAGIDYCTNTDYHDDFKTFLAGYAT